MWVTLLWGACGSNHGGAGADAPGAPGVPTSVVHGVATDLAYASPTTVMSVPRDLAGYVIQAYVPDDSPGGFRILDATVTGTSFAIPDVPDGSYTLRVVVPADPAPHFYQTTALALDLGDVQLGRVDGARATQPTVLTLHVTGLDPAAPFSDRVFIDSFATGSETFISLAEGATSLELPVDWRDLGTPLLDAAKGDDLYVVHQREGDGPTPANEVEFTATRTIADSFSTGSVTLVDGQPASVTGVSTLPDTELQRAYQLDPASFRQGIDVPSHLFMFVQMRIRAGFTGAVSQGAPLFDVFGQFVRPPQPISAIATYRDPYPADWPRFVFDFVSMSWNYAARGTTEQTVYSAQTFDRTPLGDSVLVTASFSAPHAIKVGGVDASQARAVPFDGTHPVVIEWAPVPSVSHYQVTAMQVTSDGASAALPVIATFDTTATTVAMPASLFAIGGSYAFAVAAIIAPDTDYAGGSFRSAAFPLSRREAPTARLLFAASCGNSVVDAPYEECDSGGIATADCNPDCTRPVCGDVFANTAAGERCDDGSGSGTCADDCTLTVCGDGRRNINSEECDDGNTRNGDGCSSTCQIEPGANCLGEPSVCNICGNGVPESREQCDLGAAQNGQPGACCSATCQLLSAPCP
jgi:cysteine-rich repeat protein